MKKNLYNLIVSLLLCISATGLQAQCDIAGYTDLGGPCAFSVCGYDSFCCDNAWDATCASEAAADANCQYCWSGCYDNDLDGYTNCDGDCNDFDFFINPGIAEVCGNGIDENCDGFDAACNYCCDQSGYTDLGGTCAATVCGYDSFCCNNAWDATCASEAATDANCQYCWCGCYDNDLDGYTNCDGDCSDFDFFINPGIADVCGNGIDENCDGFDAACNYCCDQSGYTDLGSPCATSVCGYDSFCCSNYWDATCASEAATDANCQNCWCGCYDNDLDGYTNCDGDCDDFDNTVYPGATEICGNGIDETCDGIDDACSFCCDLEGYTDLGSPCATSVCGYDPFCCYNYWDATCASEAIADGNCQTCWCGCYDNDLDGVTNCDGDCDDFDNTVYQGATEICGNGIDETCDGIDDACSYCCDQPNYSDLGSPCATSVCGYDPYCCDTAWDGVCAGEAASDANCVLCWCNCYDNDLDGYTNCDGDCDDSNANTNPGALEICSNGIDDNCDGTVDNAELTNYYADIDGDGFGSAFLGVFCNAPANSSITNNDCNDNNNMIYPGAGELCNGLDDDCDGSSDELLPLIVYYADSDNDGFGGVLLGSFCSAPNNSSTQAGDCDDQNSLAYPNASEICNGLDDDCDGAVDDGFTLTSYFEDGDNDGFGGNLLGQFCSQPANSATAAGDCNDANNSINPNATEVCNDIDDNCDGSIDEFLLSTFYADEDNDGFGNMLMSVQECVLPAGYVSDATDCDDTNSAVNPNATEVPNNDIDENCDGNIVIAVNEMSVNWDVQLYPNPAYNELNVVVTGTSGLLQIEIIDALGKVVMSSSIGSGTTRIDCSSFTAGAYTLTVKSIHGETKSRFLKF